MKLLRDGRTDEARNYLKRCVDITHDMALKLIKICRSMNVDCIVAPYEADGQLAYLNKINLAEYVITEDSDLVLFGCTKILFKLDLQGNCLYVDSTKLYLTMKCNQDKFSFEKFRYMCILSGCDYLDSLPGIGLAKALKFIMKTEDPDIQRALLKIPAYLNLRQINVTDEYILDFMKANATFQYMIVFDPLKRSLVRLNDLDESNLEYCGNAGVEYDSNLAYHMALGNIDPFTKKKLDNWTPDQIQLNSNKRKNSRVTHPSIWKISTADKIHKKRVVSSNNNQPKIFRSLRIQQNSVESKSEHDDEDDNKLNDFDILTKYSNVTINDSVPEQQEKSSPEQKRVRPNNPFAKSKSLSNSLSPLKKVFNSSQDSKVVISKFFVSHHEKIKEAAVGGETVVEEELENVVEPTQSEEIIDESTSINSDDIYEIKASPSPEPEIIEILKEPTPSPPSARSSSPPKVNRFKNNNPKTRRIGLSKSKSLTQTGNQSKGIQSQLSQFGFQKRPSIK